MSTTYLFRLAKTIMVMFFGFYVAIVVFGNITDYQTNYLFVKHVMSMDTTFENNSLMYRSVTVPALHHAAYVLIIVTEALIAAGSLAGGWTMARNLNADAETFHRSKAWAIAGLIAGLALWFFGFQVIAGEWFAMWQSDTWNGLEAASRLTSYIGISLIALMLSEP